MTNTTPKQDIPKTPNPCSACDTTGIILHSVDLTDPNTAVHVVERCLCCSWFDTDDEAVDRCRRSGYTARTKWDDPTEKD